MFAGIEKLAGRPILVVKETDSGRKEAIDDRLVLKETLERLQFGDCIYFDDEDRMARDNGVKKDIVKRLRKKNVRLFVRTREFDLFNIQDVLQLGLKGELDEYMGTWIVQRMHSGRVAAAKKKYMSWLPGYGLRKKKNGELERDPDETKWYDWMVEKSFEGWGFGRLAKHLNALDVPTKTSRMGKGPFKWKAGTIARILRNAAYTGERTYFGHKKISVPALISKARFAGLQEAISDHWRNRPARATRRSYLLQNLLYCGNCSRRFFGKSKTSQRCGRCELRLSQRLKSDPNLSSCPRCHVPLPQRLRLEREECYCCLSKKPDPSPRSCGMPSVSLDEAEVTVWDEVRRLATNSQKLREQLQAQQERQYVEDVVSQVELEKTTRVIEQKDRLIDGLLTNLERWDQPEYLKRNITRLHQEKEELLKAQAQLQQRLAAQEAIKKRMGTLENLWEQIGNRIDRLTNTERYDFVHSFLKRIVVSYDPVIKEHHLALELAVEVEQEVLPESLQAVLAQS